MGFFFLLTNWKKSLFSLLLINKFGMIHWHIFTRNHLVNFVIFFSIIWQKFFFSFHNCLKKFACFFTTSQRILHVFPQHKLTQLHMSSLDQLVKITIFLNKRLKKLKIFFSRWLTDRRMSQIYQWFNGKFCWKWELEMLFKNLLFCNVHCTFMHIRLWGLLLKIVFHMTLSKISRSLEKSYMLINIC